MTMLTKTIDVEVKAIGDEDSGLFQAYASVFNNVDSYGDMVVPGAFIDALKEYGAKGEGIPLYWRHRMDDPFMNLGATTEAREDEHGLWTESQLDLTNEASKYAYKLLLEGRVRQMSFAYDILEASWVERKPEDGGSYYELRKLLIHEISIVPVGANQETEILAVKSARDAAVAALIDARQKADDAALTPDGSVSVDDQGTADEPTDANAEEPDGANAEEQKSGPSAQHLGLINIYAAQ
ncbi:HK97 family phage prohead protease [Microbacterium soli]|uniref:Prohead serine protease domain-containing protein n=1 Tax=Microbacterium soli TaxID=446075 RepID=A0ABP7NKM3_9MICO